MELFKLCTGSKSRRLEGLVVDVVKVVFFLYKAIG